MAFLPIAVAVVAVCVAGHLWAEAAGHRAARAALKLAASAGFLVVAWRVGAGGRYATLVLVGLALSAVGDLLLLARARSAFLAGIGAFLLAHVAYAAAFAPSSHASVVVAAAVGVAGVAVVRWLWPHLGELRIPVVVYAAVITVMLVLAMGVHHPWTRLGAALFYVSDLTVARDRFVRPGLVNRIIGLPLYYAGQLLLALSTATPP